MKNFNVSISTRSPECKANLGLWDFQCAYIQYVLHPENEEKKVQTAELAHSGVSGSKTVTWKVLYYSKSQQNTLFPVLCFCNLFVIPSCAHEDAPGAWFHKHILRSISNSFLGQFLSERKKEECSPINTNKVNKFHAFRVIPRQHANQKTGQVRHSGG